MNKVEALGLLRMQLESLKKRPWATLRTEVGLTRQFEVTGDSGTSYQGEIQVDWDDQPDGPIRVMGSIDDGGWRAFVPLTASFILAPDGRFIGE